jgi:hypothetical protein
MTEQPLEKIMPEDWQDALKMVGSRLSEQGQDHEFTFWQYTFICSMAGMVFLGLEPSEKQIVVIRKIHASAFGYTELLREEYPEWYKKRPKRKPGPKKGWKDEPKRPYLRPNP